MGLPDPDGVSTSLDAVEDVEQKGSAFLNLRVRPGEREILWALAEKNGMTLTGYILWACGVRRKDGGRA